MRPRRIPDHARLPPTKIRPVARVFFAQRSSPIVRAQKIPIGVTMSLLTLAQASTIVDVALAKGRETNCAPLTVAVLDAGGHLVAFKREDKSGILRFDIAYGKAWCALGFGFSSRTLGVRAEQHPVFFQTIAV